MKWKIKGSPESGGTGGYVICPNCGGEVWAIWLKKNISTPNGRYRLRFCPYCGEKMEVDDGRTETGNNGDNGLETDS